MPSVPLAAFLVLLLPSVLGIQDQAEDPDSSCGVAERSCDGHGHGHTTDEDLALRAEGDALRYDRGTLGLFLVQQKVRTFKELRHSSRIWPEATNSTTGFVAAEVHAHRSAQAKSNLAQMSGEHLVADALKTHTAMPSMDARNRIIVLKPEGEPPVKGGPPQLSKMGMLKVGIVLCMAIALLSLTGRAHPRVAAMARTLRFGGYYIIVSSVMIESNKWLMQPGRFPYPFTLTFNHMLSCTILANLLRKACPSLFPALQTIDVTPRYCLKFLGLGAPFMLSVVCGNWAYKFLSVSFLQIMKQTNVVTIYVLSVIAGLEALRRCSTMLLLGILTGAMMAVRGEINFVFKGFMLQVVSSWSEAMKVVFQSFLMSGQAKLDPLTLLLFMAPACFLANLVPWAIMEGPELATIASAAMEMWPLVLGNMVLAFILNIAVAQCIREVSAVGYLLCGIVKDNCIILTSTIFLGESLSHMQQAGFTVALTGVVLYSLYKQNLDCFKDDNLYDGFRSVYIRLMYGDSKAGDSIDSDSLKHALSGMPEMAERNVGSFETAPQETRALKVVH